MRTLAGLVAITITLCAASTAEEWRLRLIDDQGFDDSDNECVTRMLDAGEYFYLGMWNTKAGTIVYRSADGENWTRISEPGMDGNRNNFATVGLVWYRGRLYVGPWNQLNGGPLFRANADADDPADIEWELITPDGFGNPRNAGCTHMREFNGYLYAGCFNYPEGSEVYRSRTGDPDSWEMVIPKAWGSKVNTDSTMMIVHDGFLYIGTESARDPEWAEGCQLWRTNGNLSPPYDQWEQVNVNGFGNGRNHNICGLAMLDGKMYAGTWNETQGFEVWRATPTRETPFSDWEKVVDAGFRHAEDVYVCSIVTLDDTLYLGSLGKFATDPPLFFLPNAKLTHAHGGLLLKSSNGAAWESIDRPGFADAPKIGVHWLTTFNGKLYAAVQSMGAPGELWVYERSDE